MTASLLPSPDPLTIDDKTVFLTSEGKLALGILAMVVLFWMTEILPFAVTGFLALVLIHLLGVDDFKAVFARGFGHSIVAFILGVLFFSMAVTRSGLGKRVVYFALGKCGASPGAVLFAFLLTGALISMWISDTAVAAMLMPIAVSIAQDEGLEPLRSNFGKALLIACVFGPSVGGIATPAGAAPNPIALSFMHDMAGVEKTFVDWMMLGIPAAALLLPVSWLILIWVFPPEIDELKVSRGPGLVDGKSPGLSRAEWFTLVIFLVTLSLWIFADWIESVTGRSVPMEYAILATSICFFLPKVDILEWRGVQRSFPWEAMLVVMVGLSLGLTVHSSGAAEWISYSLLSLLGGLSLFLLVVGTVLMISLLHNLLASNTITAVVMLPVIIHLAQAMDKPLWLAVAPAGFASTLGLILVTASPTNLIPYTARLLQHPRLRQSRCLDERGRLDRGWMRYLWNASPGSRIVYWFLRKEVG